VDDVLDGSEFRRGQRCWYRIPGVGSKAIIDAVVLLTVAEKVLEHFFVATPYYLDLLRVYNKVKWVTFFGENLESRITADAETVPLEM